MHHTKPHIHHTLVKYFRHKELDELYLSVFLKSFASSLISIFVPIYLLLSGFGIRDVALYYIVYYASVTFLVPFCMLINSKIGIKKTMAVGTFILIIFYFMLGYVDKGLPYPFAAMTFAIAVAFYYPAFHIEFTRAVVRKQEGTETSVLKIIAILCATFAPLIGSLFIAKISFGFLFILVSVLLFISAMPLFFTPDYYVKFSRISIRSIVHSDSKRKAIAYQSDGALNIVSGIFWPVFIFLTVKNIVSLGFIVSLTSLLLIVMIFRLGKLSDRSTKKTLRLGVYTHASSWIIRLVLLSPFGLFLSNLFSSMTSSAIEIPFNKIIYEKAERAKDIANYFIFREFNLEFGRLVILFAAFITQSLFWMFIASFFITFVYLIMIKEVE